MTKKHKLRR